MIALWLASLLVAAPALADIPPADACAAADAGKACDNANSDGKMDLPGTCQASKCTRTTPDGTMSYDCYVCKASDKKDDSGCSTSGSRRNGAFVLVPLVILGVLWQRRRQGGLG